eukprot:SAG31_NODE_825_length_11760_cov_5.637767_9_plen_240_part_00
MAGNRILSLDCVLRAPPALLSRPHPLCLLHLLHYRRRYQRLMCHPQLRARFQGQVPGTFLSSQIIVHTDHFLCRFRVLISSHIRTCADPFKRSTKTQRTPPPSLLRTPLADDAGKKVAQSYPSSADDAEPSSGAAETSVYKQSQFKANPQYHAQEVDPVTEANDQQSAPMRARRHSCGFHSMFLTCLGLVVLLGYGSVVLDTERWEHISEPVINTVISTLSESAANMVERGYSIHAYAW